MNDSQNDLQVPEQVTKLWNCVQEALEANNHPTPRQIDRMAAVAGEELAATTVDGWFKTWSVVPAWSRFYALIKALGAEQDEDWRSLHEAALSADRRHKREERKKKESNCNAEPHPDPVTTKLQSGAPPAVDEVTSSAAAPPTSTRAKAGPRGSSQVIAITAAVVAVALVVAILKLILPSNKGESDIIGDSSVELAQPVDRPARDLMVRYCTHVIVELAVVYSASDVSSRQIKFKYLNDEITISNRPSPAGWISVQTPWDDPGFNWMQTSALAPPTPCSD